MKRKEQRIKSLHGVVSYCSCSICRAYNREAKRTTNRVFRRRMKQQDQKELVRLDED